MKILLANKFFHLNGGSERVLFQERDFLRLNGHHVIDFSMVDERNLPSPFTKTFVPHINYEASGTMSGKIREAVGFIHSSSAIHNLKELIDHELPQVAHLHNIYHQLTPSIIPVLKEQGIKVVLTLHDYKLVCPSYLALCDEKICNACEGGKYWYAFLSNCQKSRTKGLLLSIEALYHQWKGSYDLVDIFLAPSSFLSNLISQRIPKEKLQVLRNGVDTDLYLPNYSEGAYILYLGRLSKEKGVKTLLRAHHHLHSTLPLKIVGTGPLECELREGHPGIDFLGYKSGQELTDLIANAAFVVVPSECNENCSMVVLESMALGKPVVGSRIGGIPEQIEDGATGLLFEMGNVSALAEQMEVLVQDIDLRISMGKAARIKLENEFSLKQHCTSLLGIYQELLN